MKSRISTYLVLPALLLMLALLSACRETDGPATTPITLPPDSTPLSVRPLSESDLAAVAEFVKRQRTVDQEWDQYHREFDQWRAGLTSCHRSAVQEALQGFAVGFNAVTERARDLPRASVSKELADILIAAAEAEETAFRQLRDRWQPNIFSLFEAVEQQRSMAARAQKEAEDLALESQEKLEKASDPEELLAMEDFDAAFDLVRDDWDEFHDDYASMSQEAGNTDTADSLLRVKRLSRQLSAVSKAVDELPAPFAAEDSVDMLQDAAEAEVTALAKVHEALAVVAAQEAASAREKPAAPGENESGQQVEQLLETMNPVIKTVEATLREVRRTNREFLDGSALEDLEEVQEFVGEYKKLIADWDAFHERYNDWRSAEGGCDRAEVLQSIGQFDARISELGRQVLDLPQSGYLLPVYNLLVEAAEKEADAIRALRNSWQPFTVDAFIAQERARENASRLRREANIALHELRNRR